MMTVRVWVVLLRTVMHSGLSLVGEVIWLGQKDLLPQWKYQLGGLTTTSVALL